MLKRFKNSMALLVASALLLSFSSLGCARNPAGETGLSDQTQEQAYDNGSDFNNNPSSSYTNNNNYNNTTNNGTGYGTDPYQGAVNSLSATVMNKEVKTWLYLFHKRVTATIMVTNSSQAQASGTLSITFTYKGETTETQQQEISLAAGESKQIEVKANESSDDVTVTVTPSMSAGYSAQPSYGNQANYGSTY